MATGSAAGTVVLVHGGFVDGSGWQGVYDQLKKDGYNVAVVQNPTISHADDVAVTKRETIPRLQRSSTSRPLHRTRASR